MIRPVTDLVESINQQLLAVDPIAGGDICDAWRVTTDAGVYFAKTPRNPAPGMFELESAGLAWIAETGVTTPGIVASSPAGLLLEWLGESQPTAAAAKAFGAALAHLHATPAESYGCPPAGPRPSSGWIGTLPMQFGSWDTWQQFYAEGRLRPTAELARMSGGLDASGSHAIEQVCRKLIATSIPDAEPALGPSRIHGDLWSGNVLWLPSGAALIDPAAHGGHPETDLAMLQLFGVPRWRQILAGYEGVTQLDERRLDRLSLHQLFPVLVHAALFGGGYGRQAEALAGQVLKN